jgi:23S rRNA (adenine2503-C2)-methyltransferase
MIWENIKCIPSSDENVHKYVFENETAIAEAVLYKYPTYEERTVICCSTQSGCPVGCRFCGAGDSFVRSLTATEIIAQVDHLLADKGIDASKIERFQIMFMSMGEPLLNQQALIPALYGLNSLYPQAKLLISTSAPLTSYDGIRRVSAEIENVGLQFSVHESTDEARDALIPFKHKLKLWEIAIEGERWHRATGRQPFFNYCAHEGNTSQEDVERLYKLFNPAIWQATISVICEREESVAAANARQQQLAADFQSKLMERGYRLACSILPVRTILAAAAGNCGLFRSG